MLKLIKDLYTNSSPYIFILKCVVFFISEPMKLIEIFLFESFVAFDWEIRLVFKSISDMYENATFYWILWDVKKCMENLYNKEFSLNTLEKSLQGFFCKSCEKFRKNLEKNLNWKVLEILNIFKIILKKSKFCWFSFLILKFIPSVSWAQSKQNKSIQLLII